MAILGSRYVINCRIFTRGVYTIVATFTGHSYPAVIKYAGGETVGVVAYTTVFRGGDMGSGFTDGNRSIVAGDTISGYAIVVKVRWAECGSAMAEVTILIGR